MPSTNYAVKSRERGSTIVEFLGVSLLIVVALLGLAQMAVWVWARNVAVTAANEGVRTGAEAGRPPSDGVVRAREVLHDGIGGSANSFQVEWVEDADEQTITMGARGAATRIVPFMPGFTINVQATATDEDAIFNK